MAGKDYYQTLGVPRNASDKEVRAAYRKAARKSHPDVNPGDKTTEARFKEIQEAYEVLSDKDKRAKYDQFGEAWQHAGQGFPGGGRRPGGPAQQSGPFEFRYEDLGREGGGTGDMGDIFERLFGSHGRAGGAYRRPRRGQDVEQPVEVSLQEAYGGTARILQLMAQESCTPCQGTGRSQGKMCPVCTGTGTIPRQRRLEVKIPAGVRDGSRVRIAGEGEPGVTGGAAGDLFLLVTVRPHPLFERKGDDLHTEVGVPLTRLILGGEVEVPTLKGKLMLSVPPETQNGRVFRLAAKGMPHLQGTGNGSLLVRVKAVLPTNLSPKEKELFEELRTLRAAA